MAAAPVTCGAAIEVPDCRVYAPAGPRAGSFESPERAATMFTPGATRSGLSPSSPARGPRLDNPATWSPVVPAPTASAASAEAGEDTRPPSLPPAITNNVPYRAVSVSTASSSRSVPAWSDRPRLRLTTFRPLSRAAQSMPSMIDDSAHSADAQTLAL
jgi:hypothetical protein